MKIPKVILVLVVLAGYSCKPINKEAVPNESSNICKKPNIIIFYVDDLGYGDLESYGAKGVRTPNVDKLANGGIRFTDTHSSAATCTPSRYSLLTGQYAFRNNAAILPGDAPLIIDPKIGTLPNMLKRAGYRTGIVGKWHLGLGNGDLDWNKDISPGPKEVGFDYSFLIPATGDRVPTVYVENSKVVDGEPIDDPITVSYGKNKIGNMPDGVQNKQMLRQMADPQHSNTIVNGVSRIGFMDGGKKALWKDEDFPDILTAKAISFVEDGGTDPFFLFFSFHDIHVPRIPNPRFLGKSEMGLRGDAIVQMDWMTGKIIKELKRLNMLENTLIIFTSDNGPVLNDGYEDGAVEQLGNHRPSGIYRGGKYSAYEAGTRVPTILYWEEMITPGVSNALWSQVDLYASLASITKTNISESEAIDSHDMSKILLGTKGLGRALLVEESFTLSLRNDNWKYIAPLSKDKKLPNFIQDKKIEGGHQHEPQLYNLELDPSEQNNIASSNPQIIELMNQKLDSIKAITISHSRNK